MWFLSLAVAALLVIYDVLDALIDPLSWPIDRWPLAAVALLLVIGLGTVLRVLVSDEE